MTAFDPAHEREALQLLRQAIDADPATRDALLDSLDPALAARVRTLLARVDAEADDDVRDGLHDVAGQRIGPYRVIERIGRGGMGEVFRAARDDGAFDRDVALKRIWGGFAPLTERFLRERQVLARLQHPGIAQLFDGGVTDAGQPWFAMELVRGEPITHWCDAREAALEQRVDLVAEVCAAVDFAHRALIVHRDLKPANVLVGDDGHAKLLDFGIAKLLDDADAEQTQTLAMTPAWAAPEQRDGRPVTTASDVYQLGTLLRVLLADDLPAIGQPASRMSAAYDARRRDAKDIADAIARRRGTTPDRLHARLAGDLDAIVAQATATAPEERYRSAAALAEDLLRWRDGLPVHARRAERGYRLRRAVRRHWPWLAAGTLVVAVAVGGGAYHVARLRQELARTTAARDRAAQAQRLAETQREQAEATAEYFVDLFKQARPSATEAREATARELLDRSLDTLLADTSRKPLVRAALLEATARASTYLGHNADADRAIAAAIGLLERTPGADPEALVEARLRRAGYLDQLQRPEEALRVLDAASALAARVKLRDPDLRMHLALQTANLASGRADNARVIRSYEEVMRLTANDLDRKDACMYHYSALGNLAMLDIDMGRPALADTHVRRALALRPRCHMRDPADALILRRVLAVALIDQARMDEARREIASLVPDARAYFGPTDPFFGHTLYLQGLFDVLDGRPDAVASLVPEIRATDGHVPGAYSTRSLESLEVLALVRRGDAGDTAALAQAARRTAPLVDDGRAHSDGSDTDRAALAFDEIMDAYVRCRRSPGADAVHAFDVARTQAQPLRPWRARLLADWARRCR